jgi:hypothetical protein
VARRSGLQAEVLASLALVMAAATGVLAVVLVAWHEAALQPVLASALAQEARSPAAAHPVVPGTRWWTLRPDAPPRPRQGSGLPAAETLELAARAREEGVPLLQMGGGEGVIRVAVPLDRNRMAVAELSEEATARLERAPRRVALAVLLADAAIFTIFGATLLRRRLVLPLRRLRDAAEAIARGERGARVQVEGAAETADLAEAFNAMSDGLERRTASLEKAVTDLRSANEDLRRARVGLDRNERLAAVGRLAAGVAHEVGNPMGAILAFLDLARRDTGLSETGQSHLTRAVGEGERVRRILRQLLDFSRPARGVPAPVDLGQAAEEVAGLVRAKHRYDGVSISVERSSVAPIAWADPGAVTQILLNLVLNAADAALQAEAPAVTLRIEPTVRARREGDAEAFVQARSRSDAVACQVEDSGSGVALEDHERIFDPFYTTKDPGEGTGLGLANAQRLAEENGGSVELAPSAGTGACFVLTLPARLPSSEGLGSTQVRASRST